MKTLAHIGILVTALTAIDQTALADDNIAACEIVLQQPILADDDTEKETGEAETEDALMIATFMPAEDFVFSVFDEEPGHITEVDGKVIQAVMCQRNYLVPTEFDLRMIETGIPLYLSQNFDSADSDLMAVFLKDQKFQYQYSGKDLNQDSLEILELRMATLNEALAKDTEQKEEE